MTEPQPSGENRPDVLTRSLVRAVAELSRLQPVEAPMIAPQPRWVYGLDALGDRETYQEWLSLTRARREEERRRNRERLKPQSGVPTVSVIVPVYRPDRELLEACVRSVLDQDFEKWRLCLCDDGSSDFETLAYLKQLAASDPRVAVAFRAANGGIAAATNSAVELATGDFLAFLDQDDELERGAHASARRAAGV